MSLRTNAIPKRAATAILALWAATLAGQTTALRSNLVTKLTECGATLARPGVYVVMSDLTVQGTASCFTITGSGVILFLNGHTITGDGNYGNALIHAYPPSLSSPAILDIKVLGPGTLTSGYAGVEFDGIHNSVVQNITSTENAFGFAANSGSCNSTCLSSGNVFLSNSATNNTYHGFTFNGSESSTFTGNIASNNGQCGFLLFNIVDSDFSGNTANANSQDGFLIGSPSNRNTLSDNTASGNSSYDGEDENANCAADVWSADSFGTVNQACVQ